MKACLIQRNLSNAEASRLQQTQDSQIHIFHSENVTQALEPNHKLGKAFSLDPSRRKQVSDRAFNQVIQFGGRQIKEISIFEYLKIGNSDTWNHAKFNVFYKLRYTCYELEEIRQLQANYKEIEVFSQNDLILKHLAIEPDITLYPAAQGKPANPKIHLPTLVRFAWSTLVRATMALMNESKARKSSHLIIRRPSNLIPNPDGSWANPFLGDILQKTDATFGILDDNPPPSIRKKSKMIASNKLYLGGNGLSVFYSDLVLLKAILSPSTRKKIRQALAELRKKISFLETQWEGFEDQAILYFLRKELFPEKVYLYKYFGFRKLFKSWPNLKTITATGENSGQTKAIFDAAKSCGIKTIGLQHGTVHEQHPAYCFTPEEVALEAPPNFTLVWGTEWAKQLAEKGNYNPESLILVGQPRTDWMLQNLDESKAALKPHVDIEKPIILFASQNIPDEGLRKKIVTILFETLKKIPEVELVIKLHPREPLTGFYEPLAEQTGYHNFKVLPQMDLYYLISNCAALITYTSTVGAETVYFYKKLFIIDPLGHDFMKYKKEGVAELSIDHSQFESQFRGAMADGFKINRLVYDQFIEKYSFKTDRKVAERCTAFIKSLSGSEDKESC